MATQDGTVRIFISYARDDDLAPPPGSAGEMGFVKFLHEHLDYKFKSSGPLRPAIWRDVDNIYRGEKFLPRIHDELQRSSILVVVLSQNWMSRDNCKGELEHFLEWRRKNNKVVDEDIILVVKNNVDLEDRPPGLQNQEGYQFYERTNRP